MLTFDFVLVVHLRRLQKLTNHAYITVPAQSTISSKIITVTPNIIKSPTHLTMLCVLNCHSSSSQKLKNFDYRLKSSQLITNLPKSLGPLLLAYNSTLSSLRWAVNWSTVIWSHGKICMYVIFIRCDKRTSNIKHKKQSQNDVQYKAAKPKKL